MKPIALCAALAASGRDALRRVRHRVTFVAYAICVAMTISPLYADVQTLTWNGASGAAWTVGENWLDGETPSAWIGGASASFGAGSSVSLSNSVAVSNLTAAGALAISGPNANPAFLSPSTPTLVFPYLTLDDIDGSLLMADLNGSAIGSYKPAKAYHYKRNGSTATAQFQMTHNGHLRCVKVTFTEDSDGVWAQTAAKSYYVHKDNSGELKLGEDIDTDPNTVEWSMTASASGSGMNISNMRGAGPRVKVAGNAQFGGAVALTNVIFETTKPGSQTWSAAFPSSNSCLSVKGLSDATVDKTFGVLDNAHTAWLTTTASHNVFTNMLLSRVVPVSARMAGSSMGFIADAAPYHITFNGQTMTCQFQFTANNGTYVKGCKVELTQSGANVTAKATMSYYHPGGTLGEDLDNTSGVTTYTSVSGNGIKSMVLRTVDVPSRTLGGNGAFDNMAVDNAQVILTSDGARPKKNFVARNGAQVMFTGGSGNNGNGSGKIYTFESGSVLVSLYNMATEGNATYIFDNATLYLPSFHDTWKDGQSMIRYITLRNGARTIGNPTRSGDCSKLTVLSDGTGPNVLGTGMCLYSVGNPTLYITTSADLEIPGNLYQAPGSSGTPVIKRGGAKLTLSGVNSFTGRFTIEAGTVELASDTALPTASPMTLKGGCTVTCGATTNSTGALTLSDNATINLGDGALSFADSHAETWSADATLNIVGTGNLSRKPIRFGTNGSGLTAAQLRQIRYNGEKVSLTGQGYLGGPQGFIIMVL